MSLVSVIKNKLSQIENIATLPHIAAEILDLMRNNQASMREIARVIERDPSITLKIIKVANSPLWGFAGQIDNVQRALVLLGLRKVTNIVIAVSLYSTFAKLKPNPYFDRNKFWLHSVGTGQIARVFTERLYLNFQGEEFIAALVHDIGKVILDQFFPDEFQRIIKIAHENGKELIKIEKQELGCTHAQVGSWLMQRWNLPETIIQAVEFHHHPQNAPQAKELAAIVNISEILCELWGIGFDEDVKAVSLTDLEAWSILKRVNGKIRELDIERFTFELNKEMEKAQVFIELLKD